MLVWMMALAATAGQWEPSTPQAMDLYQQAMERMQAEDPAGAEALLRRADEAESGIGLIRHGLATSLLLQDQTRAAADALERLAELFPDEVEVFRQLSQARYVQQKFPEASAAADRAVQLAPASVQAVVAARTVWLRTGEYDKVLAATEAARALNDRGEWACIDASVFLEQDEEARARALLTRCREASNRPLVTEIETKLGVRDGTMTALDAAAGAGASTAERIARAGQAIDKGDPGGAIAQLDKVLASEPQNGQARVLRGIARFLAHDDAAAREDLQTVYGAKTWIKQDKGNFTGITTKKAEERFQQVLREGAAVLVLTDLAADDAAAASRHLAAARKDLGDDPVLAAASAAVDLARGKTGAWSAFEAARGSSNSPVMRNIATEMQRVDPGGVPSGVLEWLGAGGAFQPVYNKAATLTNNKDDAGCVKVIADAIGGFSGEGARKLAEMGYRCAVGAGDLAAADRFVDKAGGAGAQPAWVGVNHAMALMAAERPADALAIADAVKPDARTARNHYAVRTEALLALGKLDRALSLADATDPWSDMRLAAEVYNAGKVDEARALLARACPLLEAGSANKASCDDLAAQMAP